MPNTDPRRSSRSGREALRDRWDGSYPIDPKKLTEDFGIAVTPASFKESGISVAIFANGSDEVKVFYHHAEDFERQRLIIARTLGRFPVRQAAPVRIVRTPLLRSAGKNTIFRNSTQTSSREIFLCLLKNSPRNGPNCNPSPHWPFFGVSFWAAQKRLQRLRKYQAIA